MSHLLRDARGSLTDVSPTPLRQDLEPVQEPLEPSQDDFSMIDYQTLRVATKLATRLIGKRAVTKTRRGEKLVWRLIGHMRRGETLEIEKLRARYQHNMLPLHLCAVTESSGEFNGRVGQF